MLFRMVWVFDLVNLFSPVCVSLFHFSAEGCFVKDGNSWVTVLFSPQHLKFLLFIQVHLVAVRDQICVSTIVIFMAVSFFLF